MCGWGFIRIETSKQSDHQIWFKYCKTLIGAKRYVTSPFSNRVTPTPRLWEDNTLMKLKRCRRRPIHSISSFSVVRTNPNPNPWVEELKEEMWCITRATYQHMHSESWPALVKAQIVTGDKRRWAATKRRLRLFQTTKMPRWTLRNWKRTLKG